MSRLRNSEAHVLNTQTKRAPSATVPLPTYDELARNVASLDPRLREDCARIKARGPTWHYFVARGIIKALLPNPCYQRLLEYTWADVVDFTADQVGRNQLIERELRTSHLPKCHERTDTQLFRSHDQMPCTHETAVRRVQKVEEMISREQPILLLGDDDMVSVELAAAGFSNVTAVDIDQRILDDIAAAAQKRKVSVRLAQHDLSKPFPSALRDDYALVMFDPAYSPDSVRMFLLAGLDATQHRPGARFFISVHLMSLLRSGIAAVDRLFTEEGLEILEFHPGFNVYPCPGRVNVLIHLVNRFVIGLKSAATNSWSFPYLISDAVVLRKT
jgi:hypothetical protein